MSTRKLLMLLLVVCFSNSAIWAQSITSYARSNAKITLEINWNADNYGAIQWQKSTDGGTTWTDIATAIKPVYEPTITSDTYFRARISSQDECEPTYITRIVKVVNFTVNLSSTTENTATFEISNADFKDANVVEYGFAYNLSDINTRNFRNMQTVKAGMAIPTESTFDIICENLLPGTAYSVRTYFKTEDGSVIYGPGKIAETQPGIKWTGENWQINKNSITARFELAGYNSVMGNPRPAFKWGTNTGNLQPVEVVDLGDFKYEAKLPDNLTPNTTYIVQAEAKIDGEAQTLMKNVRTLSDYSGAEVDQTAASVKHTVRWDATKTLHRISPEGVKAEYPRIIRVNQDTLLCSYHGGNDYWANIYLQKSYDNGRTWTSPDILMDKEGSSMGRRYWRFANPEMIKLQNGWILMSFIGNGNPETNDNCHVMAMVSKDNGETWGDPVIVGRGRTWEPMVVQLPNGELEMFIASEAAWFGKGGYLAQEILYSRSTDNGLTWTGFKRASYSPDRRDGMPVGIVMQGNKGVLFAIEIVDDKGFGSPSIVYRSLDGEWDSTPWNGANTDLRWRADIGAHGGAPYAIQLPTGEIVVSAHANGRNGIWQTGYPQIIVGDSNGKNFTSAVTPITNLPAEQGAYYNSLFLKDNETVWLVITNSLYEGGVRKKGEIKYLEGKIVDKK